MAHVRNILFDLDGTLTDPAEGIIRSIRYSLNVLRLPCPPDDELTTFIGPPLRECFSEICKSADAELIETAVTVFRERFSTVGLFENTVYDGVPEMLRQLRTVPTRLFVATSKPQVYAERILDHFSLSSYFVEIHGNDLAGTLDDKASILAEVIERHSLRPEETIMVGDRKHDVTAAKKNGVTSVGVSYGYGSLAELTCAGADYVCDQPMAVATQIGLLHSSATFD